MIVKYNNESQARFDPRAYLSEYGPMIPDFLYLAGLGPRRPRPLSGPRQEYHD
jgi:hypothetical protein